jgi:hypothetical protein
MTATDVIAIADVGAIMSRCAVWDKAAIDAVLDASFAAVWQRSALILQIMKTLPVPVKNDTRAQGGQAACEEERVSIHRSLVGLSDIQMLHALKQSNKPKLHSRLPSAPISRSRAFFLPPAFI